MHVVEHEYFAKGLTETELTTLWVLLTKHFLQCMHLLRYDSHTFLGVFSVKLHVISPVDMFFPQWSKMSCANHGLVLSHMVGKCKQYKRSYTT